MPPPEAPRLHHVALRVADPGRAADFYERLGLRRVRELSGEGGLRAVWMAAGALVLMLERELRGQGPATGSSHLLAFSTDDLGRCEALLASAGILIDDRTPSTLYFRDPDGHRVGLSVYRFEQPPLS